MLPLPAHSLNPNTCHPYQQALTVSQVDGQFLANNNYNTSILTNVM